MDVAILILAPALAWFVCDRWSRSLPAAAPLRATNYRGIAVPTACGITVMAGILCGAALVMITDLFVDDAFIRIAARIVPAFVAAAFAYGLLGLWDDVAGTAAVRGWSGHVRSLGTANPSAGAVKLVGGILFGLLLFGTAQDPVTALVAAGVVAGSANLFNLLDVRPGRALKFWLIAMVTLAVALAATQRFSAALVALIAIAAGTAFLPHDLGERAMLGDVGANAIGAVAGVAVLFAGGTVLRSVVLAVLVVLHLLADRPGLSRLIDAVPPLRALDAAGRAQPDHVAGREENAVLD